jgi:broad specificity phosphatase PhoE
MSQSAATLSGTRLLLVRHAHSTMAGRFCGHYDAPLSNAGREQLPEIVTRLEHWPLTKVYTSNLKRAYDTAAAIAASRSLPPLVRAGLCEINFGEWEGRCWEEIEAKDPAAASVWLAQYPLGAAPGGEPYPVYRSKVENELTEILRESHQHTVAVVTHAGFIRTALAVILAIPEKSWHKVDLEYGGVTVLRHGGEGWTVQGVNIQ